MKLRYIDEFVILSTKICKADNERKKRKAGHPPFFTYYATHSIS